LQKEKGKRVVSAAGGRFVLRVLICFVSDIIEFLSNQLLALSPRALEDGD
jgi:hypothetical protein